MNVQLYNAEDLTAGENDERNARGKSMRTQRTGQELDVMSSC